ncbi:MAG: hypothetical protein HGA97_10060 [Chlorobiaceae bacterium]|nr:hypothetical protein [Chlorobiaceae bacterium]
MDEKKFQLFTVDATLRTLLVFNDFMVRVTNAIACAFLAHVKIICDFLHCSTSNFPTMPQLSETQVIRVILDQAKPSGAESQCHLWNEVIPLVPDVLWVLLAFVFLFYRQFFALIAKIDGFEFKGVKLSFLRESVEGFNGRVQ